MRGIDVSAQPYSDPYYSPPPARIVRKVAGNGPVEDLASIDIQCGGFTAGGAPGSAPAPLHGGPVAAGATVSLNWTLWPDSHSEYYPSDGRVSTACTRAQWHQDRGVGI